MRLSWMVGWAIVASASGGMTIEKAKWSTNSVEVCFASRSQTKLSRFGSDSKTFPTKPKVSTVTADERSLIETIIRNEYRLDSTGFEFTGFQDCTSDTSAKIFIYLGKGGPIGAGNIGERMQIDKFWVYHDREGREVISPVYVKLETALPSYLYFQNLEELQAVASENQLPPADRLQLNALHEFGHAVGLLHEDERAEANKSPNCKYINSQSAYRVSQPVPLTSYDPASVMSYCFVDLVTQTSGLHYKVAKAGPSGGQEDGLPVLTYPGVYFEESDRIVEKKETPTRIEYRIRVGLSEKDRSSIRCMYGKGCTR